jgi:AmiR/NasT family two-component response regulator
MEADESELDNELEVEIERLHELIDRLVETAATAADDVVDVQRAHADVVMNLEILAAARDVIGQAKGILMATKRCTAETAFEQLKAQSKRENRKLVKVAAEVVREAERGLD